MLKRFLSRILPGLEGPAEDEAAAADLIAQGNAMEDRGQPEQACKLYREAVAIAPRLPRAHLNLGLGLAATGDAAGAEQAYQAVLALDAAHPYGCYNYASLRYGRGELEAAESLVRRALSAKPDFPQALLLLSNILDDRGQLEAATAAAREALRVSPDYAGGLYNLALLLEKARRPEEAMATVRRWQELGARGAEIHALLSRLFAQQGLMREALQAIRTAREVDPAFQPEVSASKELFYLNFDEGADPAEMFRLHLAYGHLVEDAATPPYVHTPDPAQASRRLRIGFVSGDLCTHPVALFLQPVLERRDRAAAEVFVYSTGERTDRVTEQLKRAADHWAEVRPLDDAALAARIHADRIDILVDLSGHSGDVRLGVFARKPAPIQAGWLGYLNTTGLRRMDYRVCDERTDPPALAAAGHTEELLHLPNSQWCYRPFLRVIPGATAPLVTKGYVTFGSFNQASKITEPMARRWAQILLRVPRSRLLVADASSPAAREKMLGVMAEEGVGAERLEFVPRTDLEAYYRLFERADIALDTYPYSGGTTTFDAIAHGVPVVTAPGPTSFSRSAASIVAPLGLGDWVAPSIDQYVDVAVRRAGEIDALCELRKRLPQALARSPFMDEERFARDLDAAWRRIWIRYCGAQ